MVDHVPCVRCGTPFPFRDRRDRARGYSIFCSNACYRAARREKLTVMRPCVVCEAPAQAIVGQPRGTIYCSDACRASTRTAARNLAKRIAPSPNTTPRTCLRCRAVFSSEGVGNRICGGCTSSDAWRAGADVSHATRGVHVR